MTTKITLDRAGRILIPKTLREEWRLNPGDTLQLDSQGEEIVTLRPVRPRALLRKVAARTRPSNPHPHRFMVSSPRMVFFWEIVSLRSIWEKLFGPFWNVRLIRAWVLGVTLWVQGLLVRGDDVL